jgi:hypothetical protein
MLALLLLVGLHMRSCAGSAPALDGEVCEDLQATKQAFASVSETFSERNRWQGSGSMQHPSIVLANKSQGVQEAQLTVEFSTALLLSCVVCSREEQTMGSPEAACTNKQPPSYIIQ